MKILKIYLIYDIREESFNHDESKIVLITLVILLNVQMLFGIQIANAENDRMFTENDKEQLDSLIKTNARSQNSWNVSDSSQR